MSDIYEGGLKLEIDVWRTINLVVKPLTMESLRLVEDIVSGHMFCQYYLVRGKFTLQML